MDFSRISKWVAPALGIAGVGVLGYVTLKATAVIPPERTEGANFIMDTFTLPGTKTDFLRAVMSAAARVEPALPTKSRILMASWAALESGWGKTKQAKQGFNLWNVSAGRAWKAAGKPVIPGGDTLYSPGSTGAVKVTQEWRLYGTLDESVKDLLTLLKSSAFINYREAYQKLLKGDETFATSLGVFDRDADKVVQRVDNRPSTAGFYTLPRSEYQAHVSKLARSAEKMLLESGIAGLMAGTQS